MAQRESQLQSSWQDLIHALKEELSLSLPPFFLSSLPSLNTQDGKAI